MELTYARNASNKTLLACVRRKLHQPSALHGVLSIEISLLLTVSKPYIHFLIIDFAAWMKNEKVTKAYNILLMTRRFNEVSRVVASEILRTSEISKRVTIIEKWAAVADICRCLHNFNGVLQICAAFTNSSVYRLKKTWEKVCKTVSVHVWNRSNCLHTVHMKCTLQAQPG